MEVTHIPGTKDNQDKPGNPVFVEGCPQMADSSALEVDNQAAVPVAEPRHMADRVDTPVDREALLVEMDAMGQIHARGG